jgi:hypothetical protein
MFNIIAFTAADYDHKHVVESAIKIASHFQVQIEFLHQVEGPANWEYLSRTTKDMYPKCKMEVGEARERFDALLREVRGRGLKASKRIQVCESAENCELDSSIQDLVVIDANLFWKLKPTKLLQSGSFLLLSNFFDPLQMSDLVINSCFNKQLKKVSTALITKFSIQTNLHKHFLFINTKENFESTSYSVARIKKTINQTGYNKTHIEVFNAQKHDEGLEEFSLLKNCDMIIIEYINAAEISQLALIEVPLLLIHS